MRIAAAPSVRTLQAEETLDAVLGPTHDAWIEEARQLLVPATTPVAPFWDRWSVVRYLDDQFLARFRVERALLSELRPFVTIHEMDRLESGGEQVARLQLALDRIGRRRGTAAEFAALTTEFLQALELWCVEIELAGARVHRDTLPADAQRMLEHLEAPSRTVCRL
jgi:hypothetical protein